MLRPYLKLFSIAFCCLVMVQANAQSKEFENVVDVTLQNTVTIKNNNSIVGYALFYKVDASKNAATYRLEILDENLKSIGSNEFEGSKELQLKNAVYESEHIMLAFNDVKGEYKKFVKVYDLKGKETGMVPYDPEKVRKIMFGNEIANGLDEMYNGCNNVDGKGFVMVYQSAAKTGGIYIQMIDKSGKLKWEKFITADEGDRMNIYLTTTTSNAIIFFARNSSGFLAKDSENFLMGFDTENGKQLYKKPMEINEMAYEPLLFKNDNNGKLKIISSLSHEKDKFLKAKAIGFNIADLNDKTGEMTMSKTFLFESDLSQLMDMKNESKSENGYLKIHDLCLMADGSKVIVGEFFRKVVSGIGVAFKVFSGGSATACEASIGDMFLLRIDSKNVPVSLEKIHKETEKITLPYDGISVGYMARMLTLNGNFGYVYTDESMEGNRKSVIANGSFDGKDNSTNSITFDEKKGFKQKKFDIEKDKKDKFYIRRGKPGHILVIKYIAKQKKILLNLERVD